MSPWLFALSHAQVCCLGDVMMRGNPARFRGISSMFDGQLMLSPHGAAAQKRFPASRNSATRVKHGPVPPRAI